jgi:hypothetical protein
MALMQSVAPMLGTPVCTSVRFGSLTLLLLLDT